MRTRRLGLFLALAGCGLGPSGDRAPGPSEGNAPWRDLGAPRVCFGEQALAPPTSAPGGLCVRATLTAPACATDGDCDSRQQCFCGRCTVAYCEVASDCEAPWFCNFGEHRCDRSCDGGCAAGEQCIGGTCRTFCLESTDCQFGEVCDGNLCIADDCSQDSDCLAGERCELQRVPSETLEPSPVIDGNTTVLYLDLADPRTPDDRAVWRATSTDGVHFTVDPLQPVLDGRAPSALIDNGSTYVYVEDPAGQGLLVATSEDGIAFTPPTVVVVDNQARAPTAVHAGGRALVYYQSGDSIALATGPVGGALAPAGIVLDPAGVEVGDGTPGTAFWTPITRLASPHALLAGPDGARTVHLWFAGFGTESAPGTEFGMPAEIPAELLDRLRGGGSRPSRRARGVALRSGGGPRRRVPHPPRRAGTWRDRGEPGTVRDVLRRRDPRRHRCRRPEPATAAREWGIGKNARGGRKVDTTPWREKIDSPYKHTRRVVPRAQRKRGSRT